MDNEYFVGSGQESITMLNFLEPAWELHVDREAPGQNWNPKNGNKEQIGK